jgi:hypothetical protein
MTQRPRRGPLLQVEAASAFDSRVDRDHEAVQEKRRNASVNKILREQLKLAGNTKLTDRDSAAELLEELWPKSSTGAAARNNLGCALAWMRCWDDALAELEASAEAPDADEQAKNRTTTNRAVVEHAREKDRTCT